MNDQMQQALVAILNKTMSGIEAGASFLQAELPDVIHQLLYWKLASSLLAMLIGIIVIFAYWRLIRSFTKSERGSALKDSWGEPTGFAFAGLVIGGCASAFSLIVIMCDGFTAMQIALAPKVYLIEYAASLAKSAG